MQASGYLRHALLLLGVLAAAFVSHADDRPIVNDGDSVREKPADTALPAIWIAGDSTVKSAAPKRGWGQDLPRFFDPQKVSIVNRAIGGRSSRTFYTEGRWQAVLDGLKPGDWVLIQFGHNDGGGPGESSRFRGSLKGTGDETVEITKPDGQVETVHTYGWYLKLFARTAREKGAHVVLCSPIPHKAFDEAGRPVRDWTDRRAWIAECARSEDARFIDLSELISRGYDRLTREEIEGFFDDARTHTNAAGSLFNARTLVSGLRALPGAPFDALLSEEGRAVPRARP